MEVNRTSTDPTSHTQPLHSHLPSPPKNPSKRPGVYALERRSHAVERQIYLLTYLLTNSASPPRYFCSGSKCTHRHGKRKSTRTPETALKADGHGRWRACSSAPGPRHSGPTIGFWTALAGRLWASSAGSLRVFPQPSYQNRSLARYLTQQ